MGNFIQIEPLDHECDFQEFTTTWSTPKGSGSETQAMCMICGKPYPDKNNGIISRSDSLSPAEFIFDLTDPC